MSDDRFEDDRHGRRRSQSEQLRESLGRVGIELDEPAATRARAPCTPVAPPVDRARVYAILMRAGAPRSALRWLTASCPSVERALAFRPWAPLADCHTDAVTIEPKEPP